MRCAALAQTLPERPPSFPRPRQRLAKTSCKVVFVFSFSRRFLPHLSWPVVHVRFGRGLGAARVRKARLAPSALVSTQRSHQWLCVVALCSTFVFSCILWFWKS